MSEHTPGPWGFEDAVHPWLITAGCDEAGCLIIVADPSWGDTEEQDTANARLIVAAPELLAACEVVGRFLGMDEDFLSGTELDEYYRGIDMMKAAIAKAKGKD